MSDASQSGGLMGNIDPDLLINLGAGLMSGAQYGSSAGEGLLRGIASYRAQKQAKMELAQGQQQLQTGALNLQRQKMMMDAAQAALQGDPGLMGGGEPSQSTAPAIPAGNASSQAVPQSAAPAPNPAQPSGLPAWLQPPTQAQIYSTPYPGVGSPNYNRAMAMFSPDPAAALSKFRADQLSGAQQQAAPGIARMDTLIKSGSPTTEVKADPELMQAWTALAPAHGFDPDKDFNDQNVRTAFTYGRNAVAAAVSKEALAPINQEQQIQGPLGQMLGRDLVTGKITQEVAPQETAQFLDENGKPVMLTKAAGMARNLQPFNPTIFGANNLTDNAIQLAADTYRTTGKMPPAFGRNPAAQAKVLDRVAQDAMANGDTAGAIAARGASLKANSSALDQVTKLEAATKGYAATMDKNIQNLTDAYQKAGSLGSPLLTRAQRAWQQGITGDKDTASMVVWLNAVQGEYAKLKSGSLGNAPATEGAMKDAKEVINKYMNQGGIQAVAQAMREESQNRMAAIAEQKQNLTEVLGTNAPGVLSPAASTGKIAPAKASAPPPRNSQGWLLHTDAQGRQAYVSPDGKQFKVVPKTVS